MGENSSSPERTSLKEGLIGFNYYSHNLMIKFLDFKFIFFIK